MKNFFIISAIVVGLIAMGQWQGQRERAARQAQEAAMTPAEKKREADFQYWSRRCGTNDALGVVEHPGNEAYLQRCLNKMVKKFEEE